MVPQGLGGDIVYISSKNSVFAGPSNIAYSAAKADQAHQVRLLAAELGEHGIRVNGINPDGVVRGSGIFAGGWGANRAAVYGVARGRARRVLRATHAAEARGPPRTRRQRRHRHHVRRVQPHHRAPRARRRRRRRRLPALTDAPPRRCRDRHRRLRGPCHGRHHRRWPGDAGSRSPLSQRCGRTGRSPPLEHHRAVRTGPRRARAPRCEVSRGRVDRHRHVGGRLRPARSRRAPARRTDRLPGSTNRRSRRARPSTRRRGRSVRINGLQFLPFNTIYQLAAETADPSWSAAAHVVLLPDLLAYWLTGTAAHRVHQRHHHRARRRDHPTVVAALLDLLGIERAKLPAIDEPGTTRGVVLAHIAERIGVRPGTVVTTVGSHDTASAVVGVPATAWQRGLHRQRHLVTRRRRTRPPRRHARSARREFHQRRWRRRPHAVPAQRRRPLAPPGVDAHVGRAGHAARPGRTPRRRRCAPRRWTPDRRRRRQLHRSRRHADAHHHRARRRWPTPARSLPMAPPP